MSLHLGGMRQGGQRYMAPAGGLWTGVLSNEPARKGRIWVQGDSGASAALIILRPSWLSPHHRAFTIRGREVRDFGKSTVLRVQRPGFW